jgi:hypothetical protein
MNKVIVAAAILIFAGASSASMIEVDRAGENTQLQLCIEKPISASVSLFAYSCLSENWQEAYIGPEVNGSIGKVNYQLAYGVGQETGGNRNGGWVWAGYKKLSGIYLSENGGSGPWTKSVIKYAVSPKVSLGYTKKDFAGEGLYAECKLTGSTTLKISGFDKFKRPEIGLNVAF